MPVSPRCSWPPKPAAEAGGLCGLRGQCQCLGAGEDGEDEGTAAEGAEGGFSLEVGIGP